MAKGIKFPLIVSVSWVVLRLAASEWLHSPEVLFPAPSPSGLSSNFPVWVRFRFAYCAWEGEPNLNWRASTSPRSLKQMSLANSCDLNASRSSIAMWAWPIQNVPFVPNVYSSLTKEMFAQVHLTWQIVPSLSMLGASLFSMVALRTHERFLDLSTSWQAVLLYTAQGPRPCLQAYISSI